MKRKILIASTVLATICLSAFTFQNTESTVEPELKFLNSSVIDFNPVSHLFEEEPELTFFYNYGLRFSEISKSTIENATLITDLYREEYIHDIVSYGKVRLTLIINESQSNIQEFSEGTALTEAQLKLLKSLDYSDNFNLRADCKRYNSETDEVEESFHSPHLTIVPEKQAVYLDGRESLIAFLAEGTLDEKAFVKGKKMRPARMCFTVTKKGKIANVKIGNHSGFKLFDEKMMQLMKELPGKWEAAENDKGEKIDQDLVVVWGYDGC